MKGKGKGQGCFLCGDPSHWNKECPKGSTGRMSAVTGEESQQENQQVEWNEHWNQDGEWYYDDWTWDESDWNLEWIGSVDEWSGGWSGRGMRTTGVTGLRTGPGTPRIGGTLSFSRARMVPPAQLMSLRTPPRKLVEPSDQNAPRLAKTVRGAKPGLMTNRELLS